MLQALRSNLKVFSWDKPDTRILLQWPEKPLNLPVDWRGRFYPTTLGTKFNSTYTTIWKLGWGQHSNIWLVKHEGYVNALLFWACADPCVLMLQMTWAALCHSQDIDSPCDTSTTTTFWQAWFATWCAQFGRAVTKSWVGPYHYKTVSRYQVHMVIIFAWYTKQWAYFQISRI